MTTEYRLVGDLYFTGDSWQIVTNSQDIHATCDSIGYKPICRRGNPFISDNLPGLLFVLIGEGEYLEVWKSDSHSIAWLSVELERIW